MARSLSLAHATAKCTLLTTPAEKERDPPVNPRKQPISIVKKYTGLVSTPSFTVKRAEPQSKLGTKPKPENNRTNTKYARTTSRSSPARSRNMAREDPAANEDHEKPPLLKETEKFENKCGEPSA